MKKIVKEYRRGKMFEVDKWKLKELLKEKLTPIVEKFKSKYEITWYEIETHNGIYKRTYEIQKTAPYSVKRLNDKLVLDITTTFLY